jgi:hypothetical protein
VPMGCRPRNGMIEPGHQGFRMIMDLINPQKWRLNSAIEKHGFPVFAQGTTIPKIIHQTYKSRLLPPELQSVTECLRDHNPGWEYRFYDDDDCVEYIRHHYGDSILRYYCRISPAYGPSRADLFRYLLMYKEGGVYLDVKSTFEGPIDNFIKPDDCFVICQWANGKGETYEGYGLHKELGSVEGGEFQQWHIITAPGSKFLRAVIDTVLTNIDRYNPWLHRVGRRGVVRLTGPIPYTLAIRPLLSDYPHRYERYDRTCGLVYRKFYHGTVMLNHYATRTDSVVVLQGIARFSGPPYSLAYKCLRNLLSMLN